MTTFATDRDLVTVCASCPCTISLNVPLHVGTAIDTYLTPTNAFTAPRKVSKNGLWMIDERPLMFGQDLLHSTTRTMPFGRTQGRSSHQLKERMRDFHEEVSSTDASGKSEALMDAFFTGKSAPQIWEDSRYDAALSRNSNIDYFIEATMMRPAGVQRSGGKTGIHQALVAAGMDISAMRRVDDLGAPAVNVGDKPGLFAGTGDWANGLAFMANGIQYVYVYATAYCYSLPDRNYTITLEFHFYDVFGLDDGDLEEYGTENYPDWVDAAQGIDAWWQLQFQHGYAPLVTRGVVERTFEVNL